MSAAMEPDRALPVIQAAVTASRALMVNGHYVVSIGPGKLGGPPDQRRSEAHHGREIRVAAAGAPLFCCPSAGEAAASSGSDHRPRFAVRADASAVVRALSSIAGERRTSPCASNQAARFSSPMKQSDAGGSVDARGSQSKVAEANLLWSAV